MAVKRTAQEAFGRTNGRLSAFAAAKLKRAEASTANTGLDASPTSRTIPIDSVDPLPSNVDDVTQSEDVVSNADRTSKLVTSLPPVKYSSVTADPRGNPTTNSDATEYNLKSADSILAVGEYDIEVLEGIITVYGAVLRKGSGRRRVYALSTHALPRIESRTPNASIRLHSVKSQIAKLEALSPLFRGIGGQQSNGQSYAVLFSAKSDVLQRTLCSIDESSESRKMLGQLCQKAETDASRLSIICIGPKSSGKSTLTRTLCNAVLTRAPVKSCLYLDIDPGQPEFGPPGQVYLVEVSQPIFGPSYTHFASRNSANYRLVAAHTLAATSFREDPQHYFACVRQLLNHESIRHGKSANKRPLIVNSCGWINGLGGRMLHDILDLGISDTVLIDVSDQDLMQTVRSKSDTCYTLPRPATRPAVRTPAELRQMQTMAYFHSRPDQLKEGIAPGLTSKPIAQWRPWIVRYDIQDSGIAAIASYGQSFNPTFLLEVLDGTLVGIVTSSYAQRSGASSHNALGALATGAPDKHWSAYVTRTTEGLPTLLGISALDPRQHECQGLAIIRSIDVKAKSLHLVTPLSNLDMAAIMQQTVLLVRGSFDNPDWAYLEDVHSGARKPSAENIPWVTRQDLVGIEGAVWRLRHPPTMMQMSGRR